MTFREYIESKKDEKSRKGEFYRFSSQDKDFPWENTNDLALGRKLIERYLVNKRPCPGRKVLWGFSDAWKDFYNERIKRKDC